MSRVAERCDGGGEIRWLATPPDPQTEESAPCGGCPNCDPQEMTVEAIQTALEGHATTHRADDLVEIQFGWRCVLVHKDGTVVWGGGVNDPEKP